MDQPSRIQYLLDSLRNGKATREELQELAEILRRSPDDADLADLPGLDKELERQWQNSIRSEAIIEQASGEKILANILNTNDPIVSGSLPQRPTVIRSLLWAAAAAAILVLCLTGWRYINNVQTNKEQTLVTTQLPVQVITPGSNRAELILADGSAIALDSDNNGSIAIQGNVSIQSIDGKIVYTHKAGASQTSPISYNTLRTPKGGFYQLTLSDGTKLWLNAASSLRYPVTFAANERVVELTGEGYFEVAKETSRPFRVVTKKMNVNVLGTHFNVMAYENESYVRTTLLEGSVIVNGGGTDALLRPGQQARKLSGDDIEILDDVNVEEVVAWKNGYFHFDRADLEVLMRQIERWYDVTVEYEGAVEPRLFGGKISRSSSIKDVIRILELSRVSFRLENKKIIVSKKIT